MSELGDYRRLVEQPMIARYEATISSLRSENERLQEALQQLVDYVKEMTEAQAALRGLNIVPKSPYPTVEVFRMSAEMKRRKQLEDHDVLVARGEAEPL